MKIKTMRLNRLAMAILCLTSASVFTVGAAENSLRVGAARVDQTGPFGPSQTGKYDHEHVYARAIVVDNGVTGAAIVSYEGPDTESNMANTLKAVADALKIPLANVLISHTHTHSSAAVQAPPPVYGSGHPEPTAPHKAILEAVDRAKGALQPARMGFDTGKLYLNVNRDAIDPQTRKWAQEANTDAISDHTVDVLTFEKPSGEPIAVYVNYAAHPINGYVGGFVSGDFPGAMSRYVEKAFGDNVVVAFSQGASGDQNALYLRPSTNVMASREGEKITGFDMNREKFEGPLRMASVGKGTAKDADPKVLDHLLRFIDAEGEVFGEEVIRVMTLTTRMTGDVRIAGEQKTVSCPGRQRTNGDFMDPSTREGMAASYTDGPPVDLRIGMIGLGTVALTSVNGEIYTQIGNRAKDSAPMKRTVITTLANVQVSGYIPDDASYGHQTFQVLLSALKPGCAEMGITNAIVDMETQYLNGK